MLISKFLSNYKINKKKLLRTAYANLPSFEGNLVNMIGKNDYISFKEFKQFFRISPRESKISLRDYVNSINDPNRYFQHPFLLNFTLNFNILVNSEIFSASLYLNLNDIDFHPTTGTIDLKFVFAKPNDTTVSQFNGKCIFKKIIEAGFDPEYRATRRALYEDEVLKLKTFTKGYDKFDDKYNNFKIIVVSNDGKEYILNYKTELELGINKWFKNCDMYDTLIVKDFVSLTQEEFNELINNYKEFHTFKSIEKLDDIDTQVDSIFANFKNFHAGQILPLIGEALDEDEDEEFDQENDDD